MTIHLYTYDDPPAAKHLEQALAILEEGGILCYPTDLNWAFGCDARSSRALERIRVLKPGHPKEQPFTLLCSSIAMVSTVCQVEHTAYRLLKKMWPGPYTVLLPRHKSLPKQLRDKRAVVGARVPQSPLLHTLIDKLGFPMASTSVPLSKSGSPYLQGWEIFDDYSQKIDLLLDLGESLPGLESTIVDYVDELPRVVRLGAGDPHIAGLPS